MNVVNHIWTSFWKEKGSKPMKIAHFNAFSQGLRPYASIEIYKNLKISTHCEIAGGGFSSRVSEGDGMAPSCLVILCSTSV
jgi:hypothetical protein